MMRAETLAALKGNRTVEIQVPVSFASQTLCNVKSLYDVNRN